MVKGHEDFVKAIDLAIQTLELLKIRIDAQQVGVKIEAEWSIWQGLQKTLRGVAGALGAGAIKDVINYTVPSGKRLFVVAINACTTGVGAGVTYKKGHFWFYIDTDIIWDASVSQEHCTVGLVSTAPLRVEAGQTIFARIINNGTAAGDFVAWIHGYEVAV